jgi:prepilin-type N-terminal cleavage/methylation domain-containing protein
MQRSGYTLIELTVALAIATVVGVASLSSFAMFNQQRVRMERVATGEDIGKTVVQYLVREAQRVGGSVLRPWQAIAVEQDPCRAEAPCNETCSGLPAVTGDRITFAFLDERAAQSSCAIEAIDDEARTITFGQVREFGDACCNLLRVPEDDPNGEPAPVSPTDLAHEHIMLFRSGATAAEEIFKAVTYDDEPLVDLTLCQFKYVESGQTRPLASVPRPSSNEFVSASLVTKLGNAIPIRVATAYVGCATTDCATHPENRGLFVFSDRDAAADTTMSISAGDDNVLVSPNIADLQVALGYDNNDDGEVLEAAGGVDDDFAGNVSPSSSPCARPDDLGTGIMTTATAVDPRALRMVAIGVVSAVRVNDPNYRAPAALPGGNLFDGAGLHFRALRSKAGFRSLNLLD